MNCLNSVVYLHIATILYSTQHFVLKLLIDHNIDFTSISFLRFSVATLFNLFQIVFNLFLNYNMIEYTYLKKEKVRHNMCYLLNCLLLSFFTYTSFLLQSIGLLYTSATKSAYILYFNMKMVVILELLLFCKYATCRIWLSVSMASVGILIICLGSNILLKETIDFNRGDLLTLVSSCFSALFIIYVGRIASFEKSPEVTNFVYLLFTSLFFGCTLINSEVGFFEVLQNSESRTLGAIFYLGLVTYVGQYLQTCGQENVEASKAALIFALDPLYNIVWSSIYLSENISLYSGIGMSIIFIATYIV